MEYDKVVGVVANWAAIITAVVAVFGYGRYLHVQWRQKNKLEAFLRDEMLSGLGDGWHSTIYLMGCLSMTEAELFSAAFRSKKIRTKAYFDDPNHAAGLRFEYIGDDLPTPRHF